MFDPRSLLLTLFALPCFAVAPAAGQAMPPPSKIDTWQSEHNQKRLKIAWEGMPEFKEKKLPNGTVEPPRAPWPFLLYVKGADSKEAEKITTIVFEDARIALAASCVKFVLCAPERAIDLPYLKSLSGIKDPSLVAIDRDFKVVGIVNEWKNFDDRGVLPLLSKASDAAYPMKLSVFVGSMFELMQQGEKSWQQEKRVDELQRKAGGADPVKQKALDEECDRIEKEVDATNAVIEQKEAALRAKMVPTEAAAEALPTTFGSGKGKRKLTPQELEAIESYRTFANNDNPVVRAAAVEDLGAIDSGVMVDFILTACNDVDLRVVEAAGKALGKMTSDESLAAMLAGLDEGGNARIAATFGFAYTKRSYPAAVPKIVAVLRGGDDNLRLAAIQALANMKDPSTVDALIESLGDKVPALRVIAAQAVGELRAQQAAPALCEQLVSANDWVLKKAAADALGKIRSRDSIEPLIARFEVEEGVLLESIYKALVDISGEDFSFEAKFWRRWWERAKNDFKLPTDEQVAAKKARIAEALAAYKGPAKHQYQSIETMSKRMVFVIDISGSMGEQIPIPDDATPEDIEAFGSRVKLDIAKNELINLLGAIGSDVEFNIITFAGSAKPWQDNLVGAGMRTSAIKFLSKLQALKPATSSSRAVGGGGGDDEQKTNVYAGILAAFGNADEGSPDWKKRGKVDTMFVVTDGVPTTGEYVDVQKMINAVTELNRTRGLTIHLVIFDINAAERMKGLAERNGGKCVVRGFTTSAPALPAPAGK